MSVVITNTRHIGGDYYEYAVRINNGPALAMFEHKRADGLAVCLMTAAEAVAMQRRDKPSGGVE
ncbi:MAG: hypothetical protein WC829_02655 [Hyphomicrobium sp.]